MKRTRGTGKYNVKGQWVKGVFNTSFIYPVTRVIDETPHGVWLVPPQTSTIPPHPIFMNWDCIYRLDVVDDPRKEIQSVSQGG